ncbi:unnamed protein product [Gongylonema pulchrum]|uniref:TPR_REGION domain-containing protein n=1 Tax=Gongylonema pulchrum TaxID=637853 RepID=A0A183DPU2_9BILA|nr:unnamed protein product [Gongylonema pulchrum]
MSANIADAENLKDEGNAAFKRGELKEAIERYTEALELDPQKSLKATIYRNRAMVRLKMDDFEGCEYDASRDVIALAVAIVKGLSVALLGEDALRWTTATQSI